MTDEQLEEEIQLAKIELKKEMEDAEAENIVLELPNTSTHWCQWLYWCEENAKPLKPSVETMKAFLGNNKVCGITVWIHTIQSFKEMSSAANSIRRCWNFYEYGYSSQQVELFCDWHEEFMYGPTQSAANVSRKNNKKRKREDDETSRMPNKKSNILKPLLVTSYSELDSAVRNFVSNIIKTHTNIYPYQSTVTLV